MELALDQTEEALLTIAAAPHRIAPPRNATQRNDRLLLDVHAGWKKLYRMPKAGESN
jgi:hypothetical protein